MSMSRYANGNMQIYVKETLFTWMLIYWLFNLAPIAGKHCHCEQDSKEVRQEGRKAGNSLNRNKWQRSAENGNEIHVKFITRWRGGVLKNGRRKIWWRSVEKRKHLPGWKEVFWLSCAGGRENSLNMYRFYSAFHSKANNREGCRLFPSTALCTRTKLYWHRSNEHMSKDLASFWRKKNVTA